jgi:hypothetical protein
VRVTTIRHNNWVKDLRRADIQDETKEHSTTGTVTATETTQCTYMEGNTSVKALELLIHIKI